MRSTPSSLRSSSAFGPYAPVEQIAPQDTWHEDTGHDAPDWALTPEDRVGPPLKPRRPWRRRIMMLAVLAAAGWTWYAGPPQAVSDWLPADLASLTQGFDIALFSGAKSSTETPPPAAAIQAPEPLPTTALAARTEALPPPEPATADHAPDEKAPPPGAPKPVIVANAAPVPRSSARHDNNAPAPPGDPLRAKAEGVGLHPDLSRVLLLRLSEADYRNAALAIRKALADNADTAVVVHPRKRQSDLAQFKVHFVTGAAAACRRYVVAIAKDGWLTTALPVEKCGVVAKRG